MRNIDDALKNYEEYKTKHQRSPNVFFVNKPNDSFFGSLLDQAYQRSNGVRFLNKCHVFVIFKTCVVIPFSNNALSNLFVHSDDLDELLELNIDRYMDYINITPMKELTYSFLCGDNPAIKDTVAIIQVPVKLIPTYKMFKLKNPDIFKIVE